MPSAVHQVSLTGKPIGRGPVPPLNQNLAPPAGGALCCPSPTGEEGYLLVMGLLFTKLKNDSGFDVQAPDGADALIVVVDV